ncbi:MAG: alpha/beta hydrolase-fold protein [Bacteroidota bacterium]
MRSLILTALCLLVLPASAQPATLTFAIDMTEASQAGWFDPATEQVGVRGEGGPLAWDRSAMADDPDGDGIFTVTLPVEVIADSLVVAYKFHASGDGNEPNGGWESGRNRTVTLRPGGAVTITRRFDEPLPYLAPTFTGTIEAIEDVPSQHLDHTRDVFVYLPPGYGGDLDQRYPVLYLHDGQLVFDGSERDEWGFDEAAEALIDAGEIEPVIIVGVANTSARMEEYTPTRQIWDYRLTRTGEPPAEAAGLARFTGRYQIDTDPEAGLVVAEHEDGLRGQLPYDTTWTGFEPVDPLVFDVPSVGITMQFETDSTGRIIGIQATRPPSGGRGLDYGRFLVEELKPAIDAQYRTDPSRASLGGASLGGLITLSLGLAYPEVFGGLLVVAPSVWWDREVLLEQVQALDAPTDQRIWLSMGVEESEGMRQGARKLGVLLRTEGWEDDSDFVYVENAGGHNEASWSQIVPDMLRFLYGVQP